MRLSTCLEAALTCICIRSRPSIIRTTFSEFGPKARYLPHEARGEAKSLGDAPIVSVAFIRKVLLEEKIRPPSPCAITLDDCILNELGLTGRSTRRECKSYARVTTNYPCPFMDICNHISFTHAKLLTSPSQCQTLDWSLQRYLPWLINSIDLECRLLHRLTC